MCSPVALMGTALAISAASSYSQIQGQQQAYQAQQQVYDTNASIARRDLLNKYESSGFRMQQENIIARREQEESQLEAREAMATARVAAGEAGVSGLSVDALLADFSRRDARHRSDVQQQADWNIQQIATEQRSQRMESENRINAVGRGERPNYLDSALRFAGSGLNIYTNYRASLPR